MRKALGGIIITLLLLLAATGCSSKDKKEMETDKELESEVSVGRYVEEDIALPQGVAANEYVSLTLSPEGNAELYVYHNEVYEKYLYQNKNWTKEDAEVLQTFNDILKSNVILRDVFYGEDKKLYLLGDTISDYHNVLYRQTDTGAFEKVELKRFEETYEQWMNIPYRPDVLKVLENGMIAAAYPWKVIEIYSPDGQSVIDEINCGKSGALSAEGNILYYIDQNDKEVLSVDMETMEGGKPRSITSNASNIARLELLNGSAYVCNTSGIHLNMEGASLWETLIDGTQSSLNMPSIEISKFLVSSEDEFYIVLLDLLNGESGIKHIFYDQTASSVPMTELSIFSLEDSPTIRQAISVFQESHPEVEINFRVATSNSKVNYTYGIKNPDQTITLQDQINALNVELLAGRGADILVLDGMPIDSYINKGVLEDMGSILTPMRNSDELLSNIIAPYFSEDKVYAVPIRFKLPVIYGNRDAVNSANSLHELADYARNNSEIPLLAPSNYRALAAWLLLTYYDELANKDGMPEEASMLEYLKDISTIADAIQASDDAELDWLNSIKGRTYGYWISSSIKVHQKKYQANIEEIGGMYEFGIPIEVANQWQGTYSVINHSYKAKGLIGINSAGKQKELAKEFVGLLLSTDIQRLDLMDGFPINKAAMEEWVQLNKSNDFASMGDSEYSFQYDYPQEKPRKDLYESICAADKPMINDMTMVDLLLDEAERYLRGDITAEQAAQNAVASVNLYLSE